MAHKLLKICSTPKKKVLFFVDLTKKNGVILIGSHQTTIVGLAVVIFSFGGLRGMKEVSAPT